MHGRCKPASRDIPANNRLQRVQGPSFLGRMCALHNSHDCTERRLREVKRGRKRVSEFERVRGGRGKNERERERKKGEGKRKRKSMRKNYYIPHLMNKYIQASVFWES